VFFRGGQGFNPRFSCLLHVVSLICDAIVFRLIFHVCFHVCFIH
jgi:hypothetical protein